jgi:hypothetical protein
MDLLLACNPEQIGKKNKMDADYAFGGGDSIEERNEE